MPRQSSGNALSGAERIRRYRERKRAAGLVQTWTGAEQEPPGLDMRDADSIIAHWDRLVRELQAVQGVARKREAWLEEIDRVDHPDSDLYDEQTADERAGDAIQLIVDTDLRTIRSSRRPRKPKLSRAARWDAAVGDLQGLIEGYQGWYDRLQEGPDGLREGPLVEKLEAVVALADQLEEFAAADLPLGWGRD